MNFSMFFAACLVCVGILFWSAPLTVLNLVVTVILLLALVFASKKYLVDQQNMNVVCNFYEQAHALDDLLLLDNERPYQKILKIVVDLGHFDWAVLFLMDFDQDAFVAVETCGIPQSSFSQISFDDLATADDHLDLSLKLLEHAFEKFELKGALAGSAIEKNEVFYGCLLVGRLDPDAALTETDNLRLNILSDQIAIGLHNYQIHKELGLRAEQLAENQMQINKELRMAKVVQESAITIKPPELDGLSVSSFVRPARFVGGDFLKFYPGCENENLTLLIGDVCGKGVPAALIMSVVLCFFQEKRALWNKPEELMVEVNRSLKEFLGAGSHFNSSALFGCFSVPHKTFTYVSAGHDFPLFYSKSHDHLLQLESTGTLLGIFAESEFSSRQLKMESGDKIVFYSDGLVDFFEEHFMVQDGFDALESFIYKSRHKISSDIVKEIQTLVEMHKTDLKDDITVAIVEII